MHLPINFTNAAYRIMPDLITHGGRNERELEGADSWQTTRLTVAQMHLSFLRSGLCFSGRKSWHKAHITASEKKGDRGEYWYYIRLSNGRWYFVMVAVPTRYAKIILQGTVKTIYLKKCFHIF